MKGELYAVYRHLESEHEGTDWAFRVHDGSLQIRHGPIDGEAGLITIPARLCHKETPWMEARMNWVACKAIEQAPFEALMERIREGLTGIGVSAHLPGSRDGERPGLVVETLTGEWAISLQPNGTLTDRGRTGPGRVPPAAGTLPMVALLRIEREFPGTLEFVWNSNRSPLRLEPEVDPEDEWLGTTVGRWDDTVAAAGAVGLIPAQVLREQERDGPTPMWF